MAMVRIVCLLLFLALVQYHYFDAPTDSILLPSFYVDARRMNRKHESSTWKTSRKLLDGPNCVGGETCETRKDEECLGDCICEEYSEDYWVCFLDEDMCWGGETCEKDGDCKGACTCGDFLDPINGSKTKECELPSDDVDTDLESLY